MRNLKKGVDERLKQISVSRADFLHTSKIIKEIFLNGLLKFLEIIWDMWHLFLVI